MIKTCPFCKDTFETDNDSRIYCSSSCRCNSYYQRNKNNKDRRAPYWKNPTSCKRCGTIFTPNRAGQLYCSKACNREDYKETDKQRREQNRDVINAKRRAQRHGKKKSMNLTNVLKKCEKNSMTYAEMQIEETKKLYGLEMRRNEQCVKS